LRISSTPQHYILLHPLDHLDKIPGRYSPRIPTAEVFLQVRRFSLSVLQLPLYPGSKNPPPQTSACTFLKSGRVRLPYLPRFFSQHIHITYPSPLSNPLPVSLHSFSILNLGQASQDPSFRPASDTLLKTCIGTFISIPGTVFSTLGPPTHFI
jgi:hypothetical protein